MLNRRNDEGSFMIHEDRITYTKQLLNDTRDLSFINFLSIEKINKRNHHYYETCLIVTSIPPRSPICAGETDVIIGWTMIRWLT